MIEGFLLTPFLYPRALDNKMSLTPRNVFDNEWAESFLIPGSSRNRVNLRSDFNWGTWQENVSSFAYRLQRREFISFRDEIISWRVKVGILKLNENWNHSSVEMIFIHQINFKLCSELKSSIRNAIVRIHFSCTVLSSLLFFFTEKIFFLSADNVFIPVKKKCSWTWLWNFVWLLRNWALLKPIL